MAYTIAIASSDGVNVDLKFGQADKFYIYRVEEKDIELAEIREVPVSSEDAGKALPGASSCGSGDENSCGSGCSGNGHGCGGGGEVIAKVALIEDSRCVVAKKVGFQAQKQFERKAISVFDIEVSVKEALDKITSYYYKIDHRQSLRAAEENERRG
jgi:predicted Fe-Mo cluster-binding NifX family protein